MGQLIPRMERIIQDEPLDDPKRHDPLEDLPDWMPRPVEVDVEQQRRKLPPTNNPGTY